MFNIAFPEFVVIVVVSLIVIGPDKLPKVANTLGVMVGRMQRFMSAVKNDLDQELKNTDLHRLQEELEMQHEGLNEQLRQGMKPVADVLRQSQQAKAPEGKLNPAPTETINKDSEQQTSSVKPEGIST